MLSSSLLDQLSKTNKYGEFLSYSSTAERLLRMCSVVVGGGKGEVGKQLLAVSSRYKSRAEQM